MVGSVTKSFVKRVQNEFETTIKKIRSDNVSEFKNTRIEDLCDDLHIGHQFSPTYTPQSNVVVERKNRTLIDMARSMLSEYNVSHSFWSEAIVGYFKRKQKNPQAHGYRCSLHPGVFQSIDFPQRT